MVLGDVSGKGVSAAALTSLARYSLRTAALFASGLEELCATLNQMLLSQTSGEEFCTLAALLIDARGITDVALAGHPPPVVARRSGELCRIGTPAPPLGLFPDVHVELERITLGDGDALVITSDGVAEARRPSGEFVPDLVDHALAHSVGASAAEIAHRLETELYAVERTRNRDDVAIVVIRRTDAARPSGLEHQ